MILIYYLLIIILAIKLIDRLNTKSVYKMKLDY